MRKYSWDVELGLDDPWLRLGTNPRLLDLANAYLGMWSKLEYVDVWYTPPAGGDERKSSQRWHRDFNDRHLLKAFLYLVDVDEDTGPFEYVPRSAPGGELERAVAVAPARRELPARGRVRGERERPLGHVHGAEGHDHLLQHRPASIAAALRGEAARARDLDVGLAGLAEGSVRAELRLRCGRRRHAHRAAALRADLTRSEDHLVVEPPPNGVECARAIWLCELRPNRRQLDLMGPQVEELMFALASPRSPQACVRELEAEDLREERHAQLVVAERRGFAAAYASRNARGKDGPAARQP